MSEYPVNEKTSVDDLLKEFQKAGIPKAESPARAHKRLSRHAGIYPVPNLAVDVCDWMFAHASEQALKEGKSDEFAKHMGRIACCAAMPKLSGANNIRDFIACVTYAMALTKRPHKRGKSSHTSTATITANT